MFRKMIKIAFAVLLMSPLLLADWDDLFRVNTDVTRKQAPRDSDCPWSIAADDSGPFFIDLGEK